MHRDVPTNAGDVDAPVGNQGMNLHNDRVISGLRDGRVTAQTASGNSMRPVILSGQRKILVPVLTGDEASGLGARPFDPEQLCEVGDLLYLTPENLRVGDAVHCKVGSSIFTHEIIEIRGEPGWPEFLIGRHDGKLNGWTRDIYGKCVRVEPYNER
jgi:hypothetical protein